MDSEEFDLITYTSNSSKGCSWSWSGIELHNDYTLAAYKIEIKREMLSEYQLKVANLYNIFIANIEKLVPNVFVKEKYVLPYENLQLYLKLGLKL